MYTGESMTVFKTLETDDLKILFKSINYKFSILHPIPTCMLLECFNELAPILLSIINKSLSTGIFPSTLKQSVVNQLLKIFIVILMNCLIIDLFLISLFCQNYWKKQYWCN